MKEKERQKRTYTERCIIGQFGEDIVAEYFSQNSDKYQYLDVSKVEYYQQKGIDFLLTIKDKNKTIFTTLDAKAVEETLFKYGNVCIKLETQYTDEAEARKRGNDAYIYKSQAEYLFYVCCQSKDIYIVKTEYLRDYIRQNIDSLIKVNYRDRNANLSYDKYDRQNFSVYVPIDDIKKVKKIKTNSNIEFKL